MAAFQDRQRALAEAAEQQGQWAQAAWAWEALLAVRPTDAVAERRLQQVRRAADARATLLAQQARLAMQLGDPASARDLYLRALAFQPSQADAIEELRTLEAAQLRGALKAPDPARNLSSSNPPLTAQTLQSAPTLQSAQATQTHATLAFASLLMAQAEHERAVQLLLPLARTAQGGPAARRLLSDVLIDLAERQRADNPVLAVTTAQRSLREDPGNQRAVSRLREWQRARAKRSASDSRVRNTDMR